MIKLFVFLCLPLIIYGLCPTGSFEWQTYCYFFQANATGFAQAETECVSRGGHLVSIHEGYTNVLLAERGQANFYGSSVTDFWIGLTDLNSFKNWTWMDKTSFDFNHWASLEPKNITGNNCIVLSLNDASWKTANCFIQKPYLCQNDKSFYEITTSVSTPGISTTTSGTYTRANVKADVVLILDGSTDVTSSQINDITDAIVNAFNNYTISEDYLNMAIIVALGDNFPIAIVKNAFRSIYTMQGLKNALKTAYDNDEWDSGSGQDLTLAQAIQQLYNPNFLKTGYRNTTQNHLTIYITTTNSPNQDAINQTSLVLQQDLFRFMAFGYQGTNNQPALTQFVGGNQDCALLTNDINQISFKISSKIWNADSNGGVYC